MKALFRFELSLTWKYMVMMAVCSFAIAVLYLLFSDSPKPVNMFAIFTFTSMIGSLNRLCRNEYKYDSLSLVATMPISYTSILLTRFSIALFALVFSASCFFLGVGFSGLVASDYIVVSIPHACLSLLLSVMFLIATIAVYYKFGYSVSQQAFLLVFLLGFIIDSLQHSNVDHGLLAAIIANAAIFPVLVLFASYLVKRK